MIKARRWLVSGRVQGVFFRASTRRTAAALQLDGHALNLTDGRVEVVARGQAPDLERLGQWLTHGPDGARVDQLEVEDLPDGDAIDAGFRIG